MYSGEIGIGATSQVILQEIALIHCTFNQFALDLDCVVDAEEDLKLLLGAAIFTFVVPTYSLLRKILASPMSRTRSVILVTVARR